MTGANGIQDRAVVRPGAVAVLVPTGLLPGGVLPCLGVAWVLSPLEDDQPLVDTRAL